MLMKPLNSLTLFEDYTKSYIDNLKAQQSNLSLIIAESIEYSLLSGGKRFRPRLGLALVESLGAHPKLVLPWLLAIEMVHTYSLIHDDLPAMDNDDFRRGKPSNHKVFGEDIALLAGDALASEAFLLISTQYESRADVALKLISELAYAMGPVGMVKGQIIDLQSKKNQFSKDDILEMHKLKTGALIQVTLSGISRILGLNESKHDQLVELGAKIGLAFQLKDDLIDSAEKIEPGSLPSCIGLTATHDLLHECHQSIRSILERLKIHDTIFASLIDFNESRQL
jgi:geranylgeranyl diphosphate synthase type II